ncbi:MAG TPA: FtsW/RodA/SpoVE family cell cycle protein [Saprospiraceae bacterium]|nr:FtsW/RodA/SpoVE family cell cycle protein [Saprospiraceae bacterium]
MNIVLQHVKDSFKGDRMLWSIILLLSLISLMAVFSASISITKYNSDTTLYFMMKHVPFILLGLAFTWLCSKIHYNEYNRFAPHLLIASIVLLIITLFFGVEVHDAKRWLYVPFTDITFQVSDLAKIALVCYLARSISAKQDYIKDFKSAFIPLLMPIIIVCGLIAPSNFSTAALLFATGFLILFMGRVSMSSLIGLVFLGVALFGVLYLINVMFPGSTRMSIWINRITEFLYTDEGGYQVQQAKIAIARGGIFGVGPGYSMLRNFIPYSYADFIYAIICEEGGLVFGILVIGLYLALLIKCVSIVTEMPKTFGAILAIGIGVNIVMQAFANIAVSTELVPVTGQTLPLVSMGGSSLLFTCISFGMLLSVSKHLREIKLESDSGTLQVDLDQEDEGDN